MSLTAATAAAAADVAVLTAGPVSVLVDVHGIAGRCALADGPEVAPADLARQVRSRPGASRCSGTRGRSR